MRNMHYGKNGPWHQNIAVGLLMYAFGLVPLAARLLAHQKPGQLFISFFLAACGAGTVIILRSVIYNFARMRHCVGLSRDVETLRDAGVISWPEYLRRQTLLAVELQRLDSLTKP